MSVIASQPSDQVAPDPRLAACAIRRMLDPRIVTRGRVVFIGLGGIGLYLVRATILFLAGILQALRFDGSEAFIEVLLCDGDSFAPENTYRMDLPGFGNKAVALGQELLDRFDRPGLVIRWAPEFVNEQNVADLVRDGDCVLLACDNHKTRHLVGRHCAGGTLNSVVLISGGNDGVENGLRGTYGNAQVFWREQRQDLTAPLDQLHPEIAKPADHSPEELSCVQQAALGAPQLSFTNLAVASAMCNALMRLMMVVDGERMYDEVALDVLDARMVPHWLSGPHRFDGHE